MSALEGKSARKTNERGLCSVGLYGKAELSAECLHAFRVIKVKEINF